MIHRAVLIALALSLAAVKANAQFIPEQKAEAPGFELGNVPIYVGRIESIEANGAGRLQQTENPSPEADLTEGYYLGLAGQAERLKYREGGMDERMIVRVRVVEVVEGKAALIEVGKAAAKKLKLGMGVGLFRPRGTTTALLKSAPDIAPLSMGGEAGGLKAGAGAAQQAILMNNLKQIALAMHKFHDVHNGLPPAALKGPDGRPWHSWRVLVLPFLDQSALYEEYRLDEPWDGPNNRKLLDRIPDVYAHPSRTGSPPGGEEATYTHYAAITGEGMAFSATAAAFDGKAENLGTAITQRKDAVHFAKIADGLSNTLMVAAVSPDRKIPWTKPEDFVVGEDFPAIGKPGGFYAPTARGALVAFCDGSVRTLGENTPLETLRALLTVNGGEVIELPSDGPRAPGGRPRAPGGRPVAVIRFVTEGDQVTAVLTMEEKQAEAELAPPPTDAPPPKPVPPPKRRPK